MGSAPGGRKDCEGGHSGGGGLEVPPGLSLDVLFLGDLPPPKKRGQPLSKPWGENKSESIASDERGP